MPTESELYTIADELRALANAGLHYDKDAYARERSHKVLGLSARLVAGLEKREASDVLLEYEGDFSCMSPAAGADVALFREDSSLRCQVLLIQRRDNGLWALPGGGAGVGETLAEAASREFLEEVGTDVRLVRLLAVLDLRRWRSQTRFHLYHHMFLGKLGAGAASTQLRGRRPEGRNARRSLFCRGRIACPARRSYRVGAARLSALPGRASLSFSRRSGLSGSSTLWASLPVCSRPRKP